MMEEIGFRNIDVKCKEMLFVFDGVEAMKSKSLFIFEKVNSIFYLPLQYSLKASK